MTGRSWWQITGGVSRKSLGVPERGRDTRRVIVKEGKNGDKGGEISMVVTTSIRLIIMSRNGDIMLLWNHLVS